MNAQSRMASVHVQCAQTVLDSLHQIVWATCNSDSESIPSMTEVHDFRIITNEYYQAYTNQRTVSTGSALPESADSVARTVHPADLQRFQKQLATWVCNNQSGELFECELRLRRYDGNYRWFLARASPKPAGSGFDTGTTGTTTSPYGSTTSAGPPPAGVRGKDVYYGNAIDIDDKIRLIEELRLFKAFAEQLPVAVCISRQPTARAATPPAAPAAVATGIALSAPEAVSIYADTTDIPAVWAPDITFANKQGGLLWAGHPLVAPMHRDRHDGAAATSAGTNSCVPQAATVGAVQLAMASALQGIAAATEHIVHSQPEASTSGEHQQPLPEGVHLRVVQVPLLNNDGDVLAAAIFAEDITAQRNRELERAREQAAEQASFRSAFGSMSHELRTPLNAVLGFAELLLTTTTTPQQDAAETESSTATDSNNDSCQNLTHDQLECVLGIRDSGALLLRIINDVLDFSKAQSGKLVLERGDLDIRRCAYLVSNMVHAEAARRSVQLQVDIDPRVPHALIGDSTRVSQVLINLVSNALRFTPEGGTVTCSINIAGQTNSESASASTTAAFKLRFEVLDTGIGLAPDAISRLFQPFVQADASTTRKYGGTGLGLSICKQLVGLMGGTIGVNSASGEGSCFWFELAFDVAEPLPDADPQPEAGYVTPVAGPRGAAVDGVVQAPVVREDLSALAPTHTGSSPDTHSSGDYRDAVPTVATGRTSAEHCCDTAMGQTRPRSTTTPHATVEPAMTTHAMSCKQTSRHSGSVACRSFMGSTRRVTAPQQAAPAQQQQQRVRGNAGPAAAALLPPPARIRDQFCIDSPASTLAYIASARFSPPGPGGGGGGQRTPAASAGGGVGAGAGGSAGRSSGAVTSRSGARTTRAGSGHRSRGAFSGRSSDAASQPEEAGEAYCDDVVPSDGSTRVAVPIRPLGLGDQAPSPPAWPNSRPLLLQRLRSVERPRTNSILSPAALSPNALSPVGLPATTAASLDRAVETQMPMPVPSERPRSSHSDGSLLPPVLRLQPDSESMPLLPHVSSGAASGRMFRSLASASLPASRTAHVADLPVVTSPGAALRFAFRLRGLCAASTSSASSCDLAETQTGESLARRSPASARHATAAASADPAWSWPEPQLHRSGTHRGTSVAAVAAVAGTIRVLADADNSLASAHICCATAKSVIAEATVTAAAAAVASTAAPSLDSDKHRVYGDRVTPGAEASAGAGVSLSPPPLACVAVSIRNSAHAGAAAEPTPPFASGGIGAAAAAAAATLVASRPATTAATPVPRASVRILLVDDNAVNRRIASKLLERLGYCSITLATDGLEAVEAVTVSSLPFALCFMDLNMPVCDGLEATRRIRVLADPVRASLPIVALSAIVDADDVTRCTAAGMQAHVGKPVSMKALEAAVETWGRLA